MKFLVKYEVRIERPKLKVSPYTGKEYKKPRRQRALWIGLSEYIQAESLEKAFKIALIRVSELKDFLYKNFPKTKIELELNEVEAEETPEIVIR